MGKFRKAKDIPVYRTFDGKRYRWKVKFQFKKDAKERAAFYRKAYGYGVRIVKYRTSYPYQLYARLRS